MSARLDLIRASDLPSWQACLHGVPHDFYHTAAYHLFAEEQAEGEAYLAVYQEADRTLLWPYLLRAIEHAGQRLFDVTSVYGYPGPLGRNCAEAEGFLSRAHQAISDLWRSQRAVTAFTRLHTILENHRLLPASAPAEWRGQTVSIDLALAAEEVWRGYRRSLRHEINQARRRGLHVECDHELRHLELFGRLYRRTMQANQAPASYHFGDGYFRRFFDRLGVAAKLLTVHWQDQIIGAGVFVYCQGIVQNHFCCHDPLQAHRKPSKLLLDEVRCQGQREGLRVFHLGGGRGAANDSLFHFKASFSGRRHGFYVWKEVLDPAVYRDLCALHNANPAPDGAAAEYFPAYRRPRLAAAVIAKGSATRPTAQPC